MNILGFIIVYFVWIIAASLVSKLIGIPFGASLVLTAIGYLTYAFIFIKDENPKPPEPEPIRYTQAELERFKGPQQPTSDLVWVFLLVLASPILICGLRLLFL